MATRGLGGGGYETGRGPPGKGGAGNAALLSGFACPDQGSMGLFGHDSECDIRALAIASDLPFGPLRCIVCIVRVV